MSVLSRKTKSPEETKEWGRDLSKRLKPGSVVALTGSLGSGKTFLVQGICSGLGVEKAVTSPTFVIINEYPGKTPLYHFDLYRIREVAEVLELGYQEYFFGEGITVIEWGERAEELLPEEHLKVQFFYQDETMREISISGRGKRFERLLQSIAA